MVTVRVAAFWSEPDSPFRVTCVWIPAVAVGPVEKVNDPELPEFTINGAGEAATADGCPLAVIVTGPAKPFTPATLTEIVSLDPGMMNTWVTDGTREKLAGGRGVCEALSEVGAPPHDVNDTTSSAQSPSQVRFLIYLRPARRASLR
jgi:hypothetical protein